MGDKMTEEELKTERRRIEAEKMYMNTKEKWTEKDFARDKELFNKLVELNKIEKEMALT